MKVDTLEPKQSPKEWLAYPENEDDDKRPKIKWVLKSSGRVDMRTRANTTERMRLCRPKGIQMLTIKQIIKVSRMMEQTDEHARRESELLRSYSRSRRCTLDHRDAQTSGFSHPHNATGLHLGM